MAFSGGSDDLQAELLHHQHCRDCVYTECPLLIDDGGRPRVAANEASAGPTLDRCPMIDCPQACGARFHECKADEHELLCGLSSVPCANREYGCTAIIRRCRLAHHLSACPASVVVCTMEWNRRMLPADQAPAWSRLPSTGTTAACQSQLDVSWAARDERRLLQSFELAGSRLAQSLRSPLTPGWPAVPFLQSPMCSNELSALRDREIFGAVQGCSAAAGDCAPDGSRTGETPTATAATATSAIQVNLCSRPPPAKTLHAGSSPKRKTPAYHVQCSLCSARRGSLLEDTDDTCLKSSILKGLNLDSGSTVRHVGGEVDDCTVGCSDFDGSASRHAPPEPSWPYSEKQRDGVGSDSGSLDRSAVREASEQASVAETEATATAVAINPASAAFTLDLVTETYNSFRVKPVNMYTFRCADSFRRDEYASHYRNVHADVQAGLGGWFEWRCPLAAYGCEFSRHRFTATCANDRVVFGPVVDGFGIASPDGAYTDSYRQAAAAVCSRSGSELPGAAAKAAAANRPSLCRGTSPCCSSEICDEQKACVLSGSADEIASCCRADARPASMLVPAAQPEEGAEHSCSPDRLTALPEELLRSVLLCLDSFSLNNVALTCKMLRNACCRLLDRRGIVSLSWKKVLIANERPTWQSTSFVWTFSKHFATVDTWYFLSDAAMINHLAMCSFNKKLRFTHPDMAKHRMHDVDSDGSRRKIGFVQQKGQCATERLRFL